MHTIIQYVLICEFVVSFDQDKNILPVSQPKSSSNGSPFFEKKNMKRYPIFSLQIYYYQIKMEFSYFLHMVCYVLHGFNSKKIWEPLNCGAFLDESYLRLHENVLEISLKIVYKRIEAFKSKGTSYL